MKVPPHPIIALAILHASARGAISLYPHHHGQDRTDSWDNHWVISIRPGQEASAQELAEELGLRNLGEIPGFPGHFLLERDPDNLEDGSDERASQILYPANRSGQPDHDLTALLSQDSRVVWAEQQFLKIRVKRPALIESVDEKSIPPELLDLWQQEENADRPAPPQPRKELFNDELWDHQWYLHDTRSRANLPDISLHVLDVWEQGINGSGVKVAVLDDGLDHGHPDLVANYRPDISYDFNDDDSDPMPRDLSNSHGTRCAGEVAMAANNRLCGVGVAYGAMLGGVRLLDGRISDRLEALALAWAAQKNVDVVSSSWGPSDDGQTVEGPGQLATAALEKGALEGRGGRGVVYVWASGNGGSRGDDCNCDGYTGSIYTLSVSSASQHGEVTWYGESCPSTLTAAYSSGAYTDQKIATTDTGGGCTVSHTGTSAAAPLAAGIVALALSVAPDLTWRDVQYVALLSSDPYPVQENSGWKRNGAGLLYNPSFGFGVLDAAAMVRLARNWSLVPEKTICHVAAQDGGTNMAATGGQILTLKFGVDKSCSLAQLEHVQVWLTVEHPKRGDLEVVLRSPMGTTTRLLGTRPLDTSARGLYNWPFMSVETWGESPKGLWEVYVADRGPEPGRSWTLIECRLSLHGLQTPHYLPTKEDLRGMENQSRKDIPRVD